MTSPKLDAIKIIEWLLFAGFGGAVRFVGERMKQQDPRFKGKDVVLMLGNAFISGFSGVLGALVISRVTEDYVYHLAAAGMFGYFGTAGIERLSNYVFNKFKV